MNVNEVIARATTDEAFARELQAAARDALQNGLASETWDKLFGYFVESPDEMANLRPKGVDRSVSANEELSPTWVTTTTTIGTTLTTTTISTLACTFTTTTTTGTTGTTSTTTTTGVAKVLPE
jgi:hypothetical protein